MPPSLKARLGALELANPVLVASGTFGYGIEYSHLVDVARLGALITKTITLSPREGNATPRIVETASGMLNSIGLENPGVEVFIERVLPEAVELGPPVIVNIAGERPENYVELARRLSESAEVAALELNVSCPNVKVGGMAFGADAALTGELVSAVRAATDLSLIVKLTPNVTDIAEIARAAEGAGADAVSLTNTLLGMAIDVATRRPRLGAVTGGLSGPAIMPVSLRMVWQAARAVGVPIVGLGGISTWEDAAAFLIAGATAVQIGTASFVDPAASVKVLDGLTEFVAAEGLADVAELTGSLKLPEGY